MVVDNSIVLAGIALILMLFMYMKVSRFWGSLMIMVMGVGFMYMEKTNSWIGLVTLTSGFLMLVMDALGGNRRRYQR